MKRIIAPTMLLVLMMLIAVSGCSKGPEQVTPEKIELAKMVPADMPMFFYLDMKAINMDQIMTKAFANSEDFDYEKFKEAGFNPEGKLAFMITDFNFDPDAEKIPTIVILIPSTNPEKTFDFVNEMAEENEQETEITREDGLITVKTEDEELYFKGIGENLAFAVGEDAKELIETLVNLPEDQSMAGNEAFQNAMGQIEVNDPAIIGFINGEFYNQMIEEAMEDADTDELPEGFFDLPEMNYAIIAGEIEESRIAIKSYASYAEELKENSLISLYLANEIPSGAYSLDEISGDAIAYMRMVINMEGLKNLISPFMEDQQEFSYEQFGFTEDEFWGMLKGDFQILLANVNFMAPQAGGVMGINDSKAIGKLMTLVQAATEGKLQGEGNLYTMTEGNNEIEIEISDDNVLVTLNMDDLTAQDVSMAVVLEQAGIDNPDQYPFIFFVDMEKVTPTIRMFAPKVADKMDWLGTIVTVSKIEGKEAWGYVVINGTGDVMEDILSLFE
ncbi:MAG: DUF3352 domain-containing protein [bacterium]